MIDAQELWQATAVIEQFAPKRPLPTSDKPYRIGYRQVAVWVVPITYEPNEQLIEVRRG